MSPLLIASKLIAGGRGLATSLVRRSPSLAIDWDTRQKSRFEAVDSSGRRVGVFLPRGVAVRGGDVLVAEDGSLIVVEAEVQSILIVRAAAASVDPALDLLRAAYHLGNRHVQLEVHVDRLVLEPDHVLAALLVRMGLEVDSARGPFDPEAGAYSADVPRTGHPHADAKQKHEHEHEHEHGHGHGHGHGHDRRGPHDR
jgi:urease accessory protein